jgi:hypothetical protein
MSGAVREWLPLGAATSPRVRDALEGAVDLWSGKWFAAVRVSLASIEPRPLGAPSVPDGWLLHAGTVAVPADGPDAIRLAGLALGADPEKLVLSEPDRDIIARLAATMCADLAATIAAALGQPIGGDAQPTATADPLERGPGLALRIDEANGRVLTRAVLPLSTLVSFIRTAVPKGSAPALARMDGAIGRTATRLDIRLGETKLSLGELAQLTPGDVLVLDRTIEAGARVSLGAAERKPFARATLEPDGDTTRLILAHDRRDT